MKRQALIVLALALAATGCVPQTGPTRSVAEEVATRVSGTLTAEAPFVPPPSVATQTSPPLATPSPTEVPTVAPPSATLSPSPSPTPTASPTSVSGDPRTTLGQPTWRDPLDSGTGWNLGEDNYTDVEVEAGKLVMVGKSTLDGWRMTWPEVQDVYLEATIEADDCTGTDHYGLMFRVPDLHSPNEGYLLGFTCDGRYWLRSWDGEQMDTLIPLTASAAINAGSDKTNRIGVKADGDRLTLYANGTMLQEITDDTWSDEGGFGVFIGARKTEGFTTRMDEIAYWDLP